ncbi:hypothetical protein C9F09_02180, partial [Salmonella enterica subsp. enterica serovar Wilhelmsburg]
RGRAGHSLTAQGGTQDRIPPDYSGKEGVLPFNKFPGVDPLLGPEMRSTGEVMGVGRAVAAAGAEGPLGWGCAGWEQGRALGAGR